MGFHNCSRNWKSHGSHTQDSILAGVGGTIQRRLSLRQVRRKVSMMRHHRTRQVTPTTKTAEKQMRKVAKMSKIAKMSTQRQRRQMRKVAKMSKMAKMSTQMRSLMTRKHAHRSSNSRSHCEMTGCIEATRSKIWTSRHMRNSLNADRSLYVVQT